MNRRTAGAGRRPRDGKTAWMMARDDDQPGSNTSSFPETMSSARS